MLKDNHKAIICDALINEKEVELITTDNLKFKGYIFSFGKTIVLTNEIGNERQITNRIYSNYIEDIYMKKSLKVDTDQNERIREELLDKFVLELLFKLKTMDDGQACQLYRDFLAILSLK